MTTYLVKLYPIDRYYFGSDTTFGADNINYFVRSVYFPQQTTLLGMLRYYLLRQNNMLNASGKVISTKNQEADLIGPSGFDALSPAEINLGIIKKLSPVFITGPDGEYFVQSREYGSRWQEDEVSGERKMELSPLKLRKRTGKNSFSKQSIHYFEGFNSKTEIPDLLVNARTGQMRYFDYQDARKHDPMNGLFILNEQVGIRLPKTPEERKNNDKGFYKQIGYTMLPEYGFAFYAEINKKSADKFDSGLTRMGADQSWFRIEITPKNDADQSILNNFSVNDTSLVKNLFRKANEFNKKVILLSDCYIEKSKYNNYPFASVSTVPFRYLKIDTNGPYSLKGTEIKLKKSEYLTLLKKGSVLYVSSELEKQQTIEYLKSKKAFYQIGYNYAI